MSLKYTEVNGVKVLRMQFNGTKSEQELLARFPKALPEGFVCVYRWLPGYTSSVRSEERYISALELFIAPVVNGKPDTNLGDAKAVEPGQTVQPVESLEVPPELSALNDKDLLSFGPQIGAKLNPRMPRQQMLAAMALACKRNPKNWEAVKRQLTENLKRREAMKGPAIGA